MSAGPGLEWFALHQQIIELLQSANYKLFLYKETLVTSDCSTAAGRGHAAVSAGSPSAS